MAHELEIIDGKARFVGSRIPGWHKLGTVIDGDVSVDEALDLAGLLNWNVRTEPVFTEFGTTIPHMRAVVRTGADGNPEGLHVVGSRWTPVQNEDAFRFAEAILTLGEKKPNVSAAGSIRNGRQVFLTLELPKHIIVGDGDTTIPFLVLVNNHDGTGALSLSLTYIRAVCANTVDAVLGRHTALRYNVRHVPGSLDRLDDLVSEAGEAMTLAYDAMDEFQTVANEWAEAKVTDAAFEAIVKGLFPEPTDDRAKVRQEARVDAFRGLYESDTQAGIRGSAWGVLQTAVEMSDWRIGSTRTHDAERLATNQVRPLYETAKFRKAAVDAIVAATGVRTAS